MVVVVVMMIIFFTLFLFESVVDVVVLYNQTSTVHLSEKNPNKQNTAIADAMIIVKRVRKIIPPPPQPSELVSLCILMLIASKKRLKAKKVM